MHASTALLLAAAGYVAAQTTTSAATSTSSSTAVSGCGSQIDSIISSCLGTTMAQYNDCATNDWDCMCTQITNVLTCYNNCPSDPNRNGVLQQQTSYCGAARAYSSATSSTGTATGSTTATASPGASSSEAATSASGSSTGTHTSSATGSATPMATTGAAVANIAYPGFAAALLGFAALL